MSIATYAELKTAVSNWIADDAGTHTDRIPEWIAMAEDRIRRDDRLRVRAMETTADLSISSRETALPSGYLAMRRLYLNTSPVRKLNFIDVDNYWATYMSTNAGRPDAYTIEGDNVVVGPTPDTTYTGKILYYQEFDALSADADTNWFLTNARGLYLYGALIEAATYLEDDARALTWAMKFDDLADQVKRSDRRDRHSGSVLVTRSDVPRDKGTGAV